ncbi:MAG TPA: 5'-nucleotidase [Myxococcota bacterium]|nr:5'-nucleotidase [Myxococcota bacterium]HRY92595.1 5'-nucleotidase [Myxococcota bacterium]
MRASKTAKALLVAAGSLLLAAACTVYNESCPITNPEVWGLVSVDLDIRRAYVRQCEAPVGNFLADALLNYDYGLTDGGAPVTVRVALINGGAIRDKVTCGEAGATRERIPRGPITDQDVYQLLPFYEDSVVVVRLTGAQLVRVLERAVSSLGATGDEAQRGYYLQVAAERGITVQVDCSLTAQTVSPDGVSILQQGQRVTAVCTGTPCVDILTDGTYYVAMLDYMVGEDENHVPNDGYVALHEPDVVVLQTYLPVIDVVKAWIQDHSAAESPGVDYPRVEGRLAPTNCDLPDCQAAVP